MRSLADEAITLVESARLLCIDVETTGLDRLHDTVCGYAIGVPGRAFYIPVRHETGNLFDDPVPFETRLAKAFAKRSRLGFPTVNHNLPFDLAFLAKRGIIVGAPVSCTMLREGLINNDYGRRGYSLEACANRWGVTAKQGTLLYETIKERFARHKKAERSLMAYFWRMPGDDPIVIDYAIGDVVSTLEVYAAQEHDIDARGARRIHTLECALMPEITQMWLRGMRVDLPYARRVREEYRQRLREALVVFPADFELGSRGDIRAWLVRQGIDSFPVTAKGNESFDEEFLAQHSPGKLILKARKYEKILSTYLEPLIDKHSYGDRIHANLVQFGGFDKGTMTGRFSCESPNMQNFPKRDEETALALRPIFIPDEGFVFGEADVNQQEPRLFAVYGGDQHLIDGYNATPRIDVHTLASQTLGLPREQVKPLGLGIFNGMWIRRLSMHLGVSVDEARRLYTAYLDLFPGIAWLMNNVRFIASQPGRVPYYVETTLGRRAYMHTDAQLHFSISRLIQGSAADQMKSMMLRGFQYANAHADDLQILMSIHDSLVFQARPTFDLGEFQAVLEDNSQFGALREDGTVEPLPLGFPVEMKTGVNWAHASFPKTYQPPMLEAAE
jgi:DNA polymerase I-like protein with 3'-5' exonuclease and polymerase domains